MDSSMETWYTCHLVLGQLNQPARSKTEWAALLLHLQAHLHLLVAVYRDPKYLQDLMLKKIKLMWFYRKWMELSKESVIPKSTFLFFIESLYFTFTMFSKIRTRCDALVSCLIRVSITIAHKLCNNISWNVIFFCIAVVSMEIIPHASIACHWNRTMLHTSKIWMSSTCRFTPTCENYRAVWMEENMRIWKTSVAGSNLDALVTHLGQRESVPNASPKPSL